ncbi:MAG: hypothetical protein V3S14_10825 [Anaerolineae bacterium]
MNTKFASKLTHPKTLGITGTVAGALGIAAAFIVPGGGLALGGSALAAAFVGYRQQKRQPDVAAPLVYVALLLGMVALLVSLFTGGA